MTPRPESIRESAALIVLPLAVAVALLSFAGNSLLCRLALRPRAVAATPSTHMSKQAIDPGTFTVVRIWAGALTLLVVAAVRRPRSPWTAVGGSWPAALALFLYAVAFSFAYTRLSTGTGALLLFGSVQLAMLVGSRLRGERFRPTDGVALGLAGTGVAVLLAPGVSAPPLGAASLMVLAGIAWGVYSLLGRRLGGDPIAATTGNFLRGAALAAALAVPLAADPLSLPSAPMPSNERTTLYAMLQQVEPRGWLLAIVSGAVTSGLGYVVWYAALRKLAAKTAALLQLTVPWIAAAGGVVLLEERPATAMFIAGPLIAAGVWFAVRPASAVPPPESPVTEKLAPESPATAKPVTESPTTTLATPLGPDHSGKR
jgi:drug/metabolite transporter (DMT)-like permease